MWKGKQNMMVTVLWHLQQAAGLLEQAAGLKGKSGKGNSKGACDLPPNIDVATVTGLPPNTDLFATNSNAFAFAANFMRPPAGPPPFAAHWQSPLPGPPPPPVFSSRPISPAPTPASPPKVALTANDSPLSWQIVEAIAEALANIKCMALSYQTEQAKNKHPGSIVKPKLKAKSKLIKDVKKLQEQMTRQNKKWIKRMEELEEAKEEMTDSDSEQTLVMGDDTVSDSDSDVNDYDSPGRVAAHNCLVNLAKRAAA